MMLNSQPTNRPTNVILKYIHTYKHKIYTSIYTDINMQHTCIHHLLQARLSHTDTHGRTDKYFVRGLNQIVDE